MHRSKCSPAIWKKLDKVERALWTALYESFLPAHNFHADWEGKKFKEQREVTAHNLACQSVWVTPIFTEAAVKKLKSLYN